MSKKNKPNFLIVIVLMFLGFIMFVVGSSVLPDEVEIMWYHYLIGFGILIMGICIPIVADYTSKLEKEHERQRDIRIEFVIRKVLNKNEKS